MRLQIVTHVSSFLLILLLAYTGSSKVVNHDSFQRVLVTMPFIGKAALLLSWTLPFLEIAIGIALIIPRFKGIGFWLSGLLISGFTVYLIIMKLSGVHLPCSCGGVIQYLSWTQHIFFNFFFIAAAVTGIVCTTAIRKTTGSVQPPSLLPT